MIRNSADDSGPTWRYPGARLEALAELVRSAVPASIDGIARGVPSHVQRVDVDTKFELARYEQLGECTSKLVVNRQNPRRKATVSGGHPILKIVAAWFIAQLDVARFEHIDGIR